MYCSGCGFGLAPGQPVCPQCGRPVMMAAPPPVPAFQFELAGYASKMRALSTVWFIYGGLALVTGFVGMAFMNAWFNGHGSWMQGPWGHTPFPPFWFGPMIRFGWTFVIARSVLALMAGYGLMERAPWGRMVAIVAAFLSILKFPFGTAIGVWTLIMLMGYRNTTLYEQISQG